jgi:hypothetical protein
VLCWGFDTFVEELLEDVMVEDGVGVHIDENVLCVILFRTHYIALCE